MGSKVIGSVLRVHQYYGWWGPIVGHVGYKTKKWGDTTALFCEVLTGPDRAKFVVLVDSAASREEITQEITSALRDCTGSVVIPV